MIVKFLVLWAFSSSLRRLDSNFNVFTIVVVANEASHSCRCIDGKLVVHLQYSDFGKSDLLHFFS